MKKLTVTYPALIAASLVLIFDKDGWILLYLAAAVLHECGHLTAILLYGGQINRITAALGGMKIDYTPCRQTSYAADAATALAGPAVNLAAALAAGGAARVQPGENLFYFCGVNLILALFNLLPAAPLDGGRALRAVLLAVWGSEKGERAAQIASLAAGVLLTAAGVLLLCCTRRNASLLLAALLALSAARENRASPGAGPRRKGGVRGRGLL